MLLTLLEGEESSSLRTNKRAKGPRFFWYVKNPPKTLARVSVARLMSMLPTCKRGANPLHSPDSVSHVSIVSCTGED